MKLCHKNINLKKIKDKIKKIDKKKYIWLATAMLIWTLNLMGKNQVFLVVCTTFIIIHTTLLLEFQVNFEHNKIMY